MELPRRAFALATAQLYNHAALPIFSFLETLYLKNPTVRRIAAIILCAYPVWSFIRSTANLPRQRLIDLFVRYVAANVLQQGGDIYSFSQLRAMADRIGGVRYGSAFSNLLLGYTHPPSDTFFELRYVSFAYPVAKWIFLGEMTLLYAACAILVWKTLRPMAPHMVHWAFIVILFGLWAPTGASLGLGQSDIWIFSLMLVAFWAFTRKRDMVAGVAIGIASLTKLTPALLLVYWAWKREWRVVFYALATMAVVLVVSLPVIEVNRWIEYATQIFPALSTGTAYAQNQSLPGLISRLMLEPKYAAGLQSAPSEPAVRVATTAAELALVGLGLIFTRGRLKSRLDFKFALEYSVWLTILLVISPISWDHYFTWMLLPVVVMLVALLNYDLDLVHGVVLTVGLAVAIWLLNTPVGTFFGYPQAWQRSPLLYGSLIILVLLIERITAGRLEKVMPSRVLHSPTPI